MALRSVPIPPDAARDAKATELAKTAHTWNIVTLRKPWGSFPIGAQFLQTPNGYRVNAVACECADYRRGFICKHVRCVVLLDAQKITKPQPAAVLATGCWQDGCESELEPGEGACWRHANVDAL